MFVFRKYFLIHINAVILLIVKGIKYKWSDQGSHELHLYIVVLYQK